MTEPTVGRMVHYVSYGTPGGEFGRECRAAVVAAVDEDGVTLCVLNPQGIFFNRCTGFNPPNPCTKVKNGEDQPEGGTWHWPERE